MLPNGYWERRSEWFSISQRFSMSQQCLTPFTKFVAILAVWLVLALGLDLSRQTGAAPDKADPLPSWNEGAAKRNILKFVQDVTTEGSPNYVPLAERIATFDNDGTLWSEQPVYFQVVVRPRPPQGACGETSRMEGETAVQGRAGGRPEGLAALGEKGFVELIAATHAGMTTEEFDSDRRKIGWPPPGTRVSNGRTRDLVYQPMLELLAYLRANGFKTFIVSGGGVEFMRAWADKVYGIPPEQVVGSSIVTQIRTARRQTRPPARLPKIQFIDDKRRQARGHPNAIGRRPIAAFGNSDGDLEMLQWTTAGRGPRFGLIVHHTDAIREWAYDRKSLVGRLDKALDEASKEGWTVVDMKKDWKVIYPFQK